MDGKERLIGKLSNMRPGQTHMIASGYRVERNRKEPLLYRLKAPNERWSSLLTREEMVRFVERDHFLNLDLLWE